MSGLIQKLLARYESEDPFQEPLYSDEELEFFETLGLGEMARYI